MTEDQIVDQLTKNHAVFATLLSNVTEDFIYWKPQEDAWSLLEIVCHLVDEEDEDFRSRIQFCFGNPGEQFPAIDPVGWVLLRKYAEQNYLQKAKTFLMERQKSIEWLKNLEITQWGNGCDHQHYGRMSARMLLENWLAHDYLHIRQITKNQFMFLKENGSNELSYAGEW